VNTRSPLTYIGGKFYSARHIIKQFPHPSAYNTYVEPFCGACHVIMQKKPYNHVEAIGDVYGDLINFWMHARDHADELEGRCRSLPYSREIYYQYHYSLFDGTELEPLERAVRWFYVMRSNFSGVMRESPNGWSSGNKDKTTGPAHSYHSAIDLFKQIQQRLQYVQIDNRDFEVMIQQYNKKNTLFFIDPPYVDCETYYMSNAKDTKEDSLALHHRLATLLNESPAYIALSYYPHPLLDDLYPASRWRRVTWEAPKHAQRTNEKHDYATELLLLNYPSAEQSLWDYAEGEEAS
jgi:DNA adenine methylase